MRTLFGVLSALCLWLSSASAEAHVVDLSQSDFTVEGATIHALVVFAKPDAARLGRMDPDHNGIVTPAELEASQAVFRPLVEHEIEVTADGARCTPTLEGGGDVEEDGFGLSIAFACPLPPHEVAVSMDLLHRLPPGHRHLLRIRAGDASAEGTLTAAHPRLDMTLPASDGATTTPAAHSPLWGALRLGVEHILTGWDHLLFLFALLLGTKGLRPIALAVSAFTVAHSITLALAASIAYVAFENVWRPGAPHRWRLTFVFGLIHGFGFAGALRQLALTRDRLLPTLLGFNVGIEVGQLLIVAVTAPAIALALRNRGGGAQRVRAASIVVGIVGFAVFVARLAFPS